ncbi:MAG: hypothetical protein KatS3mg027_0015 [Bacteroidia bacterium]|nr:MAG: hypothetical protein KatS3mg027_0015 [Bacteroidia bacterium]
MRLLLALLGLISIFAWTPAAVGAQDRSGVEFFERHIRPILVARCVRCHGPEQQKAGLRLDRAPFIRRGSDAGRVVEPGNPDGSKLIEAVRYHNPRLQMPPDGKLPEEEILLLERWVLTGAALPEEEAEAPAPRDNFDEVFRERAQHWCYQALRRVLPPPVKNTMWLRSPVDAFVLRRLEEADLPPAPEADRNTLIRRLFYDMLGLPPTPDDVLAFVQDPRPDAFDRLLDRLLASPHYGERWGRHWLDLVRFAETLGHEFDYELFNAWRYRDYVIRALNEDVPYDQFVTEHIAGDLLEHPRRDPITGINESVVATAFWWLGEAKHSPVDVKREEADRIANQLDVFGKTFLAQTLVCARCHHHKFDPVRTEDYYALAGFLTSSRYQQAFLDPPERISAKRDELAHIKERALRDWLRTVLADTTETRIRRALLAAHLVAQGADIADAASKYDIRPEMIESLVRLLKERSDRPATTPIDVLARLVKAPGGEFESRLGDIESEWQLLRTRATAARKGTLEFESFSDAQGFKDRWFVTGDAFGPAPVQPGEIAPLTSGRVRFLAPGSADSSRYTAPLEGVLRSKTFLIEKPFVHVLAAGEGGRVQVVIDNFVLIRDPIYGGLIQNVNRPVSSWYTIDVSMWLGHRAYIEVLDSSMPTLTHGLSREAQEGKPRRDWIRVEEISFSDQRVPPPLSPSELVGDLLQALRKSPDPETLSGWFSRTTVLALRRLQAADTLASGEKDAVALIDILNTFLEAGLLDRDVPASVAESYRTIEEGIPAPSRAPAMADGSGWNEYVHVRGVPENRGPVVARRFLEVFAGTAPITSPGSGRLELARLMTDPSVTPLLPRVLVNRVWQHHFGRGIVATPDDFGHMGELPTHPDLLDWLAMYFVEHGWSIKRLHRTMVLSNTYCMSGRAAPKAMMQDPENKLLHHIPVRRLEAEPIRDAILAVSGRLDYSMYGPGVLPHLTPFMEGRGRPSRSGPLDGRGRRSIYINVRRNFLTPMLLVFDYPVPFTTIGRRAVSNVPAQALTLMNGPFVVEQSRRWAEKLIHELPGASIEKRIRRLYLEAFAREPTDAELEAAAGFIRSQAEEYSASEDDVRVWADLCHVLINVKEFIFVP